MPQQSRNKTLKSLFVDTAIFIGVVALIGNVSLSIWERCIIQNNLANIRFNLHSLKELINEIGFAYDNLQNELARMVKEAEAEQLSVNCGKNNPRTPAHKLSKK